MARFGRSFPVPHKSAGFLSTSIGDNGSGHLTFSGSAIALIGEHGTGQSSINIVGTAIGSSNFSTTASANISVLANANGIASAQVTLSGSINLTASAIGNVPIVGLISFTANLTPNSISIQSNPISANVNLAGNLFGFANFENTYTRASGFPVSASSTGLTTLSVTTVNSQDLLVLYVANLNSSGFAPTSISCPNTENWSLQDTYTTASGYNISIWTSVVSTAGSTTITVTFPSSVASNTIELVADEIVPTSRPVNTALPTISGTLLSGQTVTASNGTWSAADNFAWTIYNTGNFSTSSSATSIPFPSLSSSKVAGFYSGYVTSGGTPSAGSTTGFTYSSVPNGLLVLDSSLNVSTVYAPTATQTAGILGSVALTGYASDGIQSALVTIVGNAVNSSSVSGSASVSLSAINILVSQGNGNLTLVANISNSSMSIKSTASANVSLLGKVGASGLAKANISLLGIANSLTTVSGAISIVGSINPVDYANLSIVATVTAVPNIQDSVKAFVSLNGLSIPINVDEYIDIYTDQYGGPGSTININITPSGIINLTANATGIASFSITETLVGTITLTGFISFATVQFGGSVSANISLIATSNFGANIVGQAVGVINFNNNSIGSPNPTALGTLSLVSQCSGSVLGSTPASLGLVAIGNNSVQSNANANVSLQAEYANEGSGNGNLNIVSNCVGKILGEADASLNILGTSQNNSINIALAILGLNGLVNPNSKGNAEIILLTKAIGNFHEAITGNAIISFNGKVYNFAKGTAIGTIQIVANVTFYVRPTNTPRVPYNLIQPNATLYPLPLVPNNL